MVLTVAGLSSENENTVPCLWRTAVVVPVGEVEPGPARKTGLVWLSIESTGFVTGGTIESLLKVAVTARSASIVNVQAADPEQEPDHPVKLESEAAFAVRVINVPSS